MCPLGRQPKLAVLDTLPHTLRAIYLPLALIYARSENYCIGHNGALPWQLPDEFKHFNAVTMGAAIVMGRKTYQDHCSELPGRLNIVITSQQDLLLAPGVVRTHSLPCALILAKQKFDQIFVIGGAGCLREAFPLADTVYESVVHAKLQGDTFVDAFNFADWSTDLIEQHPADARHLHAFSVYRHRRSLKCRDDANA